MKNFYIPLLTVTVIAGGLMFQLASAHGPFWQAEGNSNGDYGLQMGQMGIGQGQMLEPKSQILGLSPEELETKLESGQNFMEIAQESQEQGITKQQIHEQMQTRQQERLERLADEGRITQEQANERIEMMQEHHKQFQDGDFQHQHHHK